MTDQANQSPSFMRQSYRNSDLGLLLRRILLSAIAGSAAFGLVIGFLNSQIICVGEEAPYDLSFGPWLPGSTPAILLVVFPLLVGLIAMFSSLAERLPKSSAFGLLILANLVPVGVAWYAYRVVGDWVWLGM